MMKPNVDSIETAGMVPERNDKPAAEAWDPLGYGVAVNPDQPGISLTGRKDCPSSNTLFSVVNEINATWILLSQIPVGHPMDSM